LDKEIAAPTAPENRKNNLNQMLQSLSLLYMISFSTCRNDQLDPQDIIAAAAAVHVPALSAVCLTALQRALFS
jgi:hypothetical protein